MLREEDVLATAARQYREGDMRVPLAPARTAVLVVDMIDEFVRPGWAPLWIPDATRQAPAIGRLLVSARAVGARVVHLAYDVSEGLHGMNFPTSEFAVPIGSLAADPAAPPDLFRKVAFWHELEPRPEDLVVLKHCYSGFHQTPLDQVLRNLGIETVAVCGTMTNYCCGATAREAFWHGYHVVMLEDLCSSDSAELSRAEIATLRRGYAKVMTADAFLRALASEAGAGTEGGT